MNKSLTLITLLTATQAQAPVARNASVAAAAYYTAFPNYSDNVIATIQGLTQS
jgi:hypothetical protein